MKSEIRTILSHIKNFQSNSIFIRNFILIALILLLSFI